MHALDHDAFARRAPKKIHCIAPVALGPCPSGEVILSDPQMHTYVLRINVSFPSDLTKLCLGRGQGPRFTPTMVKKASMSSLETTSAIAFAELFSYIKRKLRRLGRGRGKLHITSASPQLNCNVCREL